MLVRRRLGRAALVVTVLLLAACNGLTVDQSGVYTSSPTQRITGTVEVGQGDTLTAVTVNGVVATVDGTTYTADVPLDGHAVLNKVLVQATYGSGQVLKERRTVVYGDGSTAFVLPEG